MHLKSGAFSLDMSIVIMLAYQGLNPKFCVFTVFTEVLWRKMI